MTVPLSALPSLNALRAFEATARLRSFSAAAQALSVTHGAVSRHIRALEASLGIALLTRGPQGAVPTPEGQRLAEGLSNAFRQIQSSVDQLRSMPLTLSCSESIMMYWLIPRLARFEQAHPGIELRFNMSHGAVDFTRDNVSVAIRLSSIDPPKDVVRHEVATEWIGPVCAPAYPGARRMRTVADLSRARLMVSRTRPGAWTDWLYCVGQPRDAIGVTESFEHFYLLIQAAKCGLGVANVPRMLVADDLDNGALVAPLGFVAGPNRLSIWVAPNLSQRPDTVRLVEWLKEELASLDHEPAVPSRGPQSAPVPSRRTVRRK